MAEEKNITTEEQVDPAVAEVTKEIESALEASMPKEKDVKVVEETDDNDGKIVTVSDVDDFITSDKVGHKADDDAGVTVTVPKKPTEEEQLPAIPEAIIEEAVRAGVNLADAQKYPSAEGLRNVIDLLTRSNADDEKNVKVESDDDSAFDIDKLFPELDPEEYEPEVIQMRDQMKEALKKQQNAINKLQEQIQASSNSARQEDATAWFDGKLNGLEGFEKTFGKGTRSEIDLSSDVFKNRQKLADRISILHAGYAANGREVSRDTLFDEAVKFEFGDVVSEIKNNKKQKEIEQRRNLQINRPDQARRRQNETKSEDDILAEIAAEVDEAVAAIKEG